MRRRGGADGVRLRLEGESPEVGVPPELLQRVVENLLDNAVSFSPKGGTVTVRVKGRGSFTEIVVEDQGPGIPEADRERIFERFYSSRPHADEGRRHAGLGLAIVKAIVQGYGGSVEADASDGQRRGARLIVVLPRCSVSSPPSAPMNR